MAELLQVLVTQGHLHAYLVQLTKREEAAAQAWGGSFEFIEVCNVDMGIDDVQALDGSPGDVSLRAKGEWREDFQEREILQVCISGCV